jgi:hypothetical protein
MTFEDHCTVPQLDMAELEEGIYASSVSAGTNLQDTGQELTHSLDVQFRNASYIHHAPGGLGIAEPENPAQGLTTPLEHYASHHHEIAAHKELLPDEAHPSTGSGAASNRGKLPCSHDKEGVDETYLSASILFKLLCN